jgi:hypothetical protein
MYETSNEFSHYSVYKNRENVQNFMSVRHTPKNMNTTGSRSVYLIKKTL